MQNTATRGTGRVSRDRPVVLRATRSRRALDRLAAAVPERAVTLLNALALVSLGAALLALILL
jgi:hypothetical protein